MKPGTKRLNLVISEDLHRDLKIASAQQAETMTDFVIQAIQEKIINESKHKDTTE